MLLASKGDGQLRPQRAAPATVRNTSPADRSVRPLWVLPFISAYALFAALAVAQTPPKITSPKEALGFNIGDDYQVANYTQLDSYWHKLAAESDRMKLVDIGPTAENRRQYMAILSGRTDIHQFHAIRFRR